jgi:hypothetical protein
MLIGHMTPVFSRFVTLWITILFKGIFFHPVQKTEIKRFREGIAQLRDTYDRSLKLNPSPTTFSGEKEFLSLLA